MLNGMLDGIPEYQAFFEDYWDTANLDKSQSEG
jgi:hypothetical protein